MIGCTCSLDVCILLDMKSIIYISRDKFSRGKQEI